MKPSVLLSMLWLIPLGCGGDRGTSDQPRDAAQAGASGAQAGASGGQAGASSPQTGASGGQAGASSTQTGTTPAQAGGSIGSGGSGGNPGTVAAGGRAGAGGNTAGGNTGGNTAGNPAGGNTGGSNTAGGNTAGGNTAGGNTGGSTGGNTAGNTGGNTGGNAGSGGAGGSTGAASTGAGGAPAGFVAFWDFQSMADNKIPEASGRPLSLLVDKGQLVDGVSGKTLALPGTQACATASAPVIDASAGFSISVWAKLDKLDTWDTFISQDGQTISPFYLQKRDTNALAFTTFPEDSTSAKACITQSALQPRVGEWYHLVATRNPTNGEQRLYVDGVLSGKATCAGGFKASGPLVVGRGRWDGPVDWITGAIDDLGVADRVLAPDEVVALYHQGRPQARHYLFAYFAEQALGRGDGLRLAHSHDALFWGAAGGGKVFMPPTVGGKSFRDPHVMRDPSGTYHLVWTTSCVPWSEPGCVQDRGFGHATSKNLATFSEAKYISVDLNAEHVWAPETIWDPASQQFMVYWATPIDNDPAVSDPHGIYYMLTKDFVVFSAPKLLFGKTGRDFIDATIIKQGDVYLMFLKDEASGQKNLRVLSSTTLFGDSAWTTDPSAPLTGNYGAEGPSPLLIDGQMILFFDKFADGAYGALRSRSLDALTSPSSWTDISSSVFFAGVRHGTAIEVPFDVFRAVALAAAD